MVFEEKQSFRQWWIIALIASIDIMFLYGFIQQFVLKVPFGDHPLSNMGFIAVFLLVSMLTGTLLILSLETRIDENGIFWRFFPIFMKEKFIPWSDVSSVDVIDYKPIMEYGGWGIRWSFGKKGVAYTVSGKKGISIQKKNGRNILIGTADPENARASIKSYYSDHLTSNHQ